MTGISLRWHATPGEMAKALRSAVPGSVVRVFTFLIPPGMLGGIYSASFAQGTSVLHRFVLSFMHSDLLTWDLKPLRETIAALRIPETDGRVELGRNTGDVLSYFLPSVGDKDSASAAQERRQRSYEDWLQAAREGGETLPTLSLPVPVESQPVACLTRGRAHFLFRLDGQGARTLEAVQGALGIEGALRLPADAPLCRDIMGEWRED